MTDMMKPAALESPAEGVPKAVLADGRGRRTRQSPPSLRAALLRYALASVLALVLLVLTTVLVSRYAAQEEAVHDARNANELVAATLIEPNLSPGLRTSDPAAVAALDEVVRTRLLETGRFVRVKLWTAEGRVVYADEPQLIGQVFPLGEDELAALREWRTDAEVSDLSLPENQFERSAGRLLEVYGAVSAPGVGPLLFETYSDWSAVTDRQSDVLRTFIPILLGALVLLELLHLPLVAPLVRRLPAAQRESEELLHRAVVASDAERRRIAGNLHDGVVQDLAGASYVMAGAVDEASRQGRAEEASRLASAAAGIRESIRGLRSLIVEIYPPNLRAAGLAAALNDLAAPLRTRGTAVELDVAHPLDLSPAAEALLFRVAQEALRNAGRHSGANLVRVTAAVREGTALLEVVDDGVGLDVDRLEDRVGEGHVGLRLLADTVLDAGGLLTVATRPGRGTALRLEVPAT